MGYRHKAGSSASGFVLTLTLLLAGCGSGGANTAPVKGKVTANGQPVTGGEITLTPSQDLNATIAGGTVASDGTFVLTTETEGDGAAIGMHTVSYSPPALEQPEWDGYGAAPATKVSPFEGLVPKQPEVEIKPGANDLTIELVKGRPQP
ncbi:MAG: hypothetical protein L0211_20900 [Planctomycetaceae bacterium]|nr:hypothetical protein [Planctomycetaceae bacterium]